VISASLDELSSDVRKQFELPPTILDEKLSEMKISELTKTSVKVKLHELREILDDVKKNIPKKHKYNFEHLTQTTQFALGPIQDDEGEVFICNILTCMFIKFLRVKEFSCTD
jgi:hypothetical protein